MRGGRECRAGLVSTFRQKYVGFELNGQAVHDLLDGDGMLEVLDRGGIDRCGLQHLVEFLLCLDLQFGHELLRQSLKHFKVVDL